MKQAFSLRNSYFGYDPRALPWAGIRQAFGLGVTAFGPKVLSPSLRETVCGAQRRGDEKR